MEINGLKIRDMKDVQDVLMALETIKLSIENLSDDMSNNYHNYSSLNEDIRNSVYSQKELIEGISHLQMKAKTMLDNINTLNTNTKVISNNTINNLKEEFENFDNQIKNTLSNVVNDIDLSTFRKQVETLFNTKVSTLEIEVRRLSKLNDDLNNINKNINENIKSINEVTKVVNWKVILGVGFTGIFTGALLMMFFGLDIAKSQIFEDEQIAINNYNTAKIELQEKYKSWDGLQDFVKKHNITVKYGVYNDTTNPFIYFKLNEIENTDGFNFERNGNKFIGFRDNLSQN